MIIIEHYIRSQRMENIAMAEKQKMDAMWDDSPIDVSTEVNFIWSIANKLRGTYQSDKYKDVIIPMVITGCGQFLDLMSKDVRRKK